MIQMLHNLKLPEHLMSNRWPVQMSQPTDKQAKSVPHLSLARPIQCSALRVGLSRFERFRRFWRRLRPCRPGVFAHCQHPLGADLIEGIKRMG
jgi:hypothetical protein